MDFLLARIDQLEKDKTKLIRENNKLEFENRKLKSDLRDEQIKVRLLSAKEEIKNDKDLYNYLNRDK